MYDQKVCVYIVVLLGALANRLGLSLYRSRGLCTLPNGQTTTDLRFSDHSKSLLFLDVVLLQCRFPLSPWVSVASSPFRWVVNSVTWLLRFHDSLSFHF